MIRKSLYTLALASVVAGCQARDIRDFPANVAIVISDGLFVSEASAPFDIYAHAGPDRLEPYFVAASLDPVVGYYGEQILPDYTFDDAPPADILVVPSGAASMADDLEDEAYIGYIREAARDAAWVTSHCWGAFALAAAGVLDGVQATTFPGYTDALAEAFPAVDVVAGDRWIQDDHVVTSNGGLAAYEASLHVVEEVFGADVADEVAQGLVFDEENLAYARDPRIGSAPGSSDTYAPLDAPLKVGVLIMDGLFINEAVAPWDIFAHGGDSFEVYFVAPTHDPIVGYYGERIVPHYAFDDAPQADVLVIPSGAESMGAQLEDTAMIAWVADQAAGARYITSHCWGAFTLASAGLLDGRSATTFPGYFQELRDAFPAIGEVVEDRRVVVDGNVVTSNGGLAAYEAALTVVEDLLGPTAGEVIAGGLVFASSNLDNARDPYIAP